MSEAEPSFTNNDAIDGLRTQVITEFTKLETALNSILFAGLTHGRMGATIAAESNITELHTARNWLASFSRQTIDGWFLRQRASGLGKKGEAAALQNLNSFKIAHHVDGSSNRAELGTELSVAQFMTLVTLGMLYNMRSVNYDALNRKASLGNDTDIVRKQSFWMFNWQPETVFGQLEWIKGTGHWATTTPVDLVINHTEQYLRFAHFVSALIVATETSVVEMKRSIKRKKTQASVQKSTPFTVLIPPDMILKIPENSEETSKINKESPDSATGQVPDSFLNFINGLKF